MTRWDARILRWPLVAMLWVALTAACSDDTLKRLGDTCARDGECSSGRCDELVCKSSTPLGPGERCASPFECASENCAVVDDEARCGPGTRAIGAACSDALQCASAQCVAGICSEGVVDGGPPAPDGSAGDLALPDIVADAGEDAQGDTTMDAGSDASPDATVDATTQPPSYLWHKSFGGTGNDHGWWVGVDSQDNVYFVATFTDTVDPGGGNITAKGDRDFVIVSFSADGAFRWQKPLGGTLGDYGLVLAVDGSSNVYVAGHYQGTANMGGGEITALGLGDIFVTSFTSGGTHRWQKNLGGASSDFCFGMAVDGNDNVFLAGSFVDTADLGDGTVSSVGASQDAYVTSFTADGVHRWKKTLGGSSSDTGYNVAVDASGNVTVVGEYDGTADFGGGSVTSKGSSDVFLASFDSAGVFRWQRTLGGTYFDSAEGLVADSDGNLYVTGYFGETADLGGGEVTGKGEIDIFVTSFSAAGDFRWQHPLGGLLYDYPHAVAVDSDDNIYLTGRFDGLPDLGGGSIGAQGGTDLFVTSFTKQGAHRWQKAYGGSGDDEANHVMVDRHGHVYLSGLFRDTGFDLGSGAIASNGGDDIFLAKFVP